MEDPKLNVEEVIEAEIVKTDEPEASSPESDQVNILFSLEEMIKNHIASLDSLREEMRKQREMFEDVFANDQVFRENAEKAKEANKIKSTTRQQILSQPAVNSIQSKIKSIRTDIKERQAALSDYLMEYQRISGANEIEGKDGEIREIINSAKLIKKSSKYR